MRLIVTVGGGIIASFLCDALSKTIEYRHLHGDVSLESVQNRWLVVFFLSAALVAGVVFLYRMFGKAAFRWRAHYFPSLGETIETAVILPMLLVSLWSAVAGANRYGQTPGVSQPEVLALHFLIILLTIAVTYMLFMLTRDLLLVRQVGWRHIEQMEAARVKEEGPLYPGHEDTSKL